MSPYVVSIIVVDLLSFSVDDADFEAMFLVFVVVFAQRIHHIQE